MMPLHKPRAKSACGCAGACPTWQGGAKGEGAADGMNRADR